MGDRIFQRKKRNDIKRKRRPVMFIVAEGKNKTEKQYFGSFQYQDGKYTIRFAPGLETDPIGMFKVAEKVWKKYELSNKEGDKEYIVLDIDCNLKKLQLINELQKKTRNIRFITSNPCIEVWFILHFIYTTHQYKDSKEPKKELSKYIQDYDESMDISDILLPMLDVAVKNLEQLKNHYKTIGVSWGNIKCNPMTDILEMLEELEVCKK